MEKYLKQYSKLKKPYKIAVIFIGISTILLLVLIFIVVLPLLNISANQTNAITSSRDFDRIVILNNILSILIVISSTTALISVLIGKKSDKRKTKK